MPNLICPSYARDEKQNDSCLPRLTPLPTNRPPPAPSLLRPLTPCPVSVALPVIFHLHSYWWIDLRLNRVGNLLTTSLQLLSIPSRAASLSVYSFLRHNECRPCARTFSSETPRFRLFVRGIEPVDATWSKDINWSIHTIVRSNPLRQLPT